MKDITNELYSTSNDAAMGQQGFSNGIANSNNAVAKGQVSTSNGIAKAQVKHRKALPTPMQGHSKTLDPLEMRAFVTGTAINIAEKRFPVYGLFVLSVESREIFIKTSKAECVSLTSQQRFSTNVQGYPVTVRSLIFEE